MAECAVSGALLSSGLALGAVLAKLAGKAGYPAEPPPASATARKSSRAVEEVVVPPRERATGFSVQEAMARADAAHEAAKARAPAEVLAELQRGNTRFWMNAATRPETSAFERRALIGKQFPSTAVLGCADSRVPVEIVFDQGLGDLFVVRVAGNCLDTTTTGSLQFAVNHLKVKVLVVMGHEACGAVKAAQLPTEAIEKEPKGLSDLLLGLKKNLDADRLGEVDDAKARDREAVTTNVRRQVDKLLADKGIMAKVASKELIIVGAYYALSTGIVDFFHEVSEVPAAGKAALGGA